MARPNTTASAWLRLSNMAWGICDVSTDPFPSNAERIHPLITSQQQARPMVTVVIPTCNRMSVLLKCLEALARQTWPQPQRDVIVVDDGSTDGTFDSLRPFIQSGELRYHRLSSGGPARARNVGLRLALGEIIVFIGDDIICTP